MGTMRRVATHVVISISKRVSGPRINCLSLNVGDWRGTQSFGVQNLITKIKLFRFLKPLAFPTEDYRAKIFKKGYTSYLGAKKLWKKQNKDKAFPPFHWDIESPGAISVNLQDVWKDEEDLQQWIDALPIEDLTEQAYRRRQGAITILETHQPSNRPVPI